MLAEAFEFRLHGIDAVFDVAGGRRELICDAEQPLLLFNQVGLRGAARQRFDAARTSGDRRFPEDENKPDLSCVMDVRAATEFGAERFAFFLDLDNAHFGAVLVAEKCERTGIDCRPIAGRPPGHLEVVPHLFVRDLLDLGRASRGVCSRCVKSKRRRCGRDKRALLAHMRAQHRAERSMEDVRAGVVTRGAVTPAGVDDSFGGLCHADLTLAHAAAVDDCATVSLRVFHRKDAGRRANVPVVAGLAASFWIERRRRRG